MSKEYQYNIQETSLLQNSLTKLFWNPIVSRIPASWTPNSITCFGAFMMFLGAVCMYFAFVHNFSAGFLLNALAVLIYMTCDNIDGMHARRTGQSSKLGEFLDHWFDSMHLVNIIICVLLIFNVHGGMLMAAIVVMSLAFFATIWEQHHTGVFYSGKIGTNEGLIVISILYCVSFFLYGKPWFQYVDYKIINMGTILAYITLLVCVLTVLGTWYRVRAHFLDYIPIILILIALGLWYLGANFNPLLTCLLGLTINTFFCGKFLLGRLVQLSFPYRNALSSLFGILGIVLFFLYKYMPTIGNSSTLTCFYYFVGVGATWMVLVIFYDFILALKHLRK